jgi:hypothetical protein
VTPGARSTWYGHEDAASFGSKRALQTGHNELQLTGLRRQNSRLRFNPYDGTVTRSIYWAAGLTRSLTLAVVTILTAGFLTVVPARAETVPQLSLAMSTLAVSGSDPDDTIAATLTVTNTGSIPAYGVVAKIWRSRDPLLDKTSLVAATTDSGTGDWPNQPGNYRLITNSTTAFAAGTTSTFTLTATLGQLGFDTKGAAYAFGVDVVATADQSSNTASVAKIRTFIPVANKTVPVTSVVLLSTTPTKLATNLFANEDLTTELTGRLNTLLTAAEGRANWLIDPALLDEVRDQADGYQVVNGSSTVAGTGQQAAIDWLARFDRLDHSRGGRTLFANPDTYGAQVAGLGSLANWSTTASATVTGISDLPLVVAPTNNVVTTATLKSLAGAGVSGVLTGNARVAGAVQTANELKILGTASLGWGTGATDATSTITQQQLALAETVISGRAGEVRLLRSAADVSENAATLPDWTTQRPLAELLRANASTDASLTSTTTKCLSETRFSEVNRLKNDITTYRQLVPNSQLAAAPEAIYLRSLASAWINNSSGSASYLDGQDKLFSQRAVAEKVGLHAISHFTMSARSNQFPITITNNLTEPVRAKVVVTTDNPQRLSVPATEVVTVGPGESQTVNIRPEATANGLITASARLATEDGRTVGDPVELTFEVTDLGVVAWIIVVISGAVLVGATTWRIRQVRRRTDLAEAAAQPAPPESDASTETSAEAGGDRR